VKNPVLRWAAAAAGTVLAVAALWSALAGREAVAPRPVRAPERPLVLAMCRSVGPAAVERGEPAGRGPAGRMVESGRPRAPLAPSDLAEALSAPAAPAAGRERPGPQGLPPAAEAAAAAERGRAAAAAGPCLPADYAPARRKVPPAAAPAVDFAAAMRAAEAPRLRGRPVELPAAADRPAAEARAPVGPPEPGKLPAPVVPLPIQ